ncbi:MAG: DUF4390 domain-containing protein [Gammaproteobacteria bacterium SHHR-1]
MSRRLPLSGLLLGLMLGLTPALSGPLAAPRSETDAGTDVDSHTGTPAEPRPDEGPRPGIEIQEIEVKIQQGFYLLEAFIDYRLSQAVLEALHSGVAMVFQVYLQVQPSQARFWQYPILERRLPYQLRYHALASVYELIKPEAPQVLRFATLAAALRALGTLEPMRLVPLAHLDAGQAYELRMEARLDIESLPAPLRPLAYLSQDWSIHQETRRWPLQP